MARPYFRVGPSIWLEQWDDDTRYIAFYVLTCEHRTTEGIFRMPVEYAIADLGWPARRFKRAFHELQRTGFIAYDQDVGVCLILKALVWQAPENPNQVKAALKAFARVPQTPLRRTFAELADRYSQRLAQALHEAFPELFAEPFAEPFTEAFADPPSPSPSPSHTPLTPQGGNGTRLVSVPIQDDLVAPRRPKTNRKRDLDDWQTSFDDWAAEHFPGCSSTGIRKVVGFMPSTTDCTPEAIRGWAKEHRNFAHLVEPAA